VALPLRAWAAALAATGAGPVSPVGPESPESTTGLEIAVEVAGPVSPVLVAEDWAVEAPESPEAAVGSTVPRTSPPSPPLASALAMESPPTTSQERRAAKVTTMSTSTVPAPVAWTVAVPVSPVVLESPDVAIGLETAVEEAGPVLPVLVAEDWAVEAPESPDVAVGSTVP